MGSLPSAPRCPIGAAEGSLRYRGGAERRFSASAVLLRGPLCLLGAAGPRSAAGGVAVSRPGARRASLLGSRLCSFTRCASRRVFPPSLRLPSHPFCPLGSSYASGLDCRGKEEIVRNFSGWQASMAGKAETAGSVFWFPPIRCSAGCSWHLLSFLPVRRLWWWDGVPDVQAGGSRMLPTLVWLGSKRKLSFQCGYCNLSLI